jgi:hypothetical protein
MPCGKAARCLEGPATATMIHFAGRILDTTLTRISQCAQTARIAGGGRFHPESCRFDLVAGRDDILEHACALARTNGGAPGVDGESFAAIAAAGLAAWLAGIRQDLSARTYRPAPVRRVMIPKPGGGERPLGIPTVRMRRWRAHRQYVAQRVRLSSSGAPDPPGRRRAPHAVAPSRSGAAACWAYLAARAPAAAGNAALRGSQAVPPRLSLSQA